MTKFAPFVRTGKIKMHIFIYLVFQPCAAALRGLSKALFVAHPDLWRTLWVFIVNQKFIHPEEI